MAFLDTVIIFTGQHKLLADFYRAGLDLPEPFGDTHLGIQLEGYNKRTAECGGCIRRSKTLRGATVRAGGTQVR